MQPLLRSLQWATETPVTFNGTGSVPLPSCAAKRCALACVNVPLMTVAPPVMADWLTGIEMI